MDQPDDKDKETEPLTSNRGSVAAVAESTDGTGSRRNSVYKRSLYRPGSISSQLALADGSAVALSSLGKHGVESSGSRANISMRSRTPSGKSIVSRVVSRAEYQRDLKPSLTHGLNRNLLLMSFIIVMSTSYQFGYNIGVLNQPVALIKQFYNESYSGYNPNVDYGDNNVAITGKNTQPIDDYTLTFLWSFTTTLFVIGGMIGAYVAGFMANKIGRKRAVLVSCVPAIIGAVLSTCCVVANSIALLMIGRFVTGVNCGLATQLAPMYLLEVVPFNLKGAFGTAHQLFITIGIFVSAILGLREVLGTESGWPYLLLLNGAPAVLCLAVLPFLPDSPRYLMLVRKNRAAAEKALIFLRSCQDVSADIEEMETELQGTGEKFPKDSDAEDGDAFEKKNLSNGGALDKTDDDTFTMMRLLKSRDLRMPLFIAVFLQVIQQLSGINAIFFYSTGIYENAGVPKFAIQYAVLVTNAVNVIMTFVAVPVMDKAGRRLLLLVPMVAMVLILALITIALKLQSDLQWMSYVSIGCVLAYVISFAIGLGPIPTMVGAELFRQGPRPFVMSLAGLTNWIFTAIVAISFEMIQKLTREYTFIIFLILMIGFTFFVYFLVPETKNKTFEEIASLWQPGDKIEVEELVDDPIYTGTEFARDFDESHASQSNGDRKWDPAYGKAAVFAADVGFKIPNEDKKQTAVDKPVNDPIYTGTEFDRDFDESYASQSNGDRKWDPAYGKAAVFAADVGFKIPNEDKKQTAVDKPVNDPIYTGTEFDRDFDESYASQSNGDRKWDPAYGKAAVFAADVGFKIPNEDKKQTAVDKPVNDPIYTGTEFDRDFDESYASQSNGDRKLEPADGKAAVFAADVGFKIPNEDKKQTAVDVS